jgi:YfiH family protein
MIHKKSGEIQWLEFDLLTEIPGLVHGVFLRHGGVSVGPYASLNAGDGSGDDPKNVAENRRRILAALEIQKWVSGNQVHSNEVIWIQDLRQNAGHCDGLITDLKNLGLLIKHADCQAAIFYDSKNGAIANVHAGWRGNVKNIYRATVQKMAKTFGSKPEDLLVGISPSLGPEYAEFINYQTEFPQEFWEFQSKSYYFNLWKIARHQLESAGVLSHHIQIAEICTRTNAQDYFSYRREKASGRHATLIALN